jgi:molybdate transport system substrate-binding protein
MKRAVIQLAACVVAGCVLATAQEATRVRVAAAADLKFALDEIVARFHARHPSFRVEPTYGSSGHMHAQLKQRAPYDLFLSADIGYPRDLVASRIGAPADVFAYARGRLVVWVPARSNLPIERDGIRALVSAGRIAIANPRHAPYGRAAEAAMKNAGIWPSVQNRLVLGESVSQAAQFVESGAAAAGVIARSLVLAPAMKGAGRYRDVPLDLHPPLDQGGLILPWAASRTATVTFRDFLLGPEGRRILTAFGFEAPGI